VSAALLATSQLGLMYSQEARPYATLLFFSLLTQLLFLRAVRTSRASTWCAFVIAATLTVDTHYYGAFLVAALFVYWMTVRKHYAIPAWWWLGGALAGAALLAPWVFGGMREQMAYWVPQAVRDVQPPWFSTTWLTPIRTLNMFNNGKFSGVLDSAPRWTFVTGSLLYTLPAIAAILTAVDRSAPAGQGFARRDAILFLVITAGVPFVAAVGLGFKGVVYDVRYVSFCVAPYYVLVAGDENWMDACSWRLHRGGGSVRRCVPSRELSDPVQGELSRRARLPRRRVPAWRRVRLRTLQHPHAVADLPSRPSRFGHGEPRRNGK
jgi:uncharacterized membrane protein